MSTKNSVMVLADRIARNLVAEQTKARLSLGMDAAIIAAHEALGTAEAAVRSCVSLMAAVMGQREDLLAYWLDLYFQVRIAYEREARHEDPAVRNLVRIEDLYPLLNDMFTRELRNALDGKTVVPLAGIPADRPDEPEPKTVPETTVAEIMGPKIGVKGWAAKKTAIRDRLIAARKDGVTIAQIVDASAGGLTDSVIFKIINTEKVPFDAYRALGAALEALGK